MMLNRLRRLIIFAPKQRISTRKVKTYEQTLRERRQATTPARLHQTPEEKRDRAETAQGYRGVLTRPVPVQLRPRPEDRAGAFVPVFASCSASRRVHGVLMERIRRPLRPLKFFTTGASRNSQSRAPDRHVVFFRPEKPGVFFMSDRTRANPPLSIRCA